MSAQVLFLSSNYIVQNYEIVFLRCRMVQSLCHRLFDIDETNQPTVMLNGIAISLFTLQKSICRSIVKPKTSTVKKIYIIPRILSAHQTIPFTILFKKCQHIFFFRKTLLTIFPSVVLHKTDLPNPRWDSTTRPHRKRKSLFCLLQEEEWKFLFGKKKIKLL